MKKLTYIRPEMTIVTVELQQMIAFSGGDQTENITITEDQDMGDLVNQARGDFGFSDDGLGDW